MTLNAPGIETMERRQCPFLGKRCLGAKCALWMHYAREDGKVFEACTFVLGTLLQQQAVVEQIRTQAGVDKMATETREAGARVAAAASETVRGVVAGIAHAASRRLTATSRPGALDVPGDPRASRS